MSDLPYGIPAGVGAIVILGAPRALRSAWREWTISRDRAARERYVQDLARGLDVELPKRLRGRYEDDVSKWGLFSAVLLAQEKLKREQAARGAGGYGLDDPVPKKRGDR